MANELVYAPTKWLQKDSPLTPTERLVLCALCIYTDNTTGACSPATETLAGHAGIDRRSVQRALRGLTEKGAIQSLPNKGGRHHTTRYIVDGFPVLKGDGTPLFTRERVTNGALKGDKSSTKGRHCAARTALKNFSSNNYPTISQNVSIEVGDDGAPITYWRGRPSC